MKPINEKLYKVLQNKFGKVKITNSGVEAKYRIVADALALHFDPSTPKKINMINWGETYSVNCPKCRDKRSRLYIGHVWGTRCEEAGKRIYSCVKCHNEACDWSDLWEVLYGNSDIASYDVKTDSLKTGVDIDARKMELPGEVDDLVPVNELPEDHPAVSYLMSRGFKDIDKMACEYQFCYCKRSPWKRSFMDSGGTWHTITPEGRLIIPNVQQGIWQGWMARYIGAIPCDPSTGKPVIQKYLNAPGYSFSSSVYRLEDARKFTDGKFCIVCEGALSAIACGPAGVCTFGMYPKPMQEELLASAFKDGQIIFMVEHEAALNKRIFECIARLDSKVSGGCLTVELPKGHDPATMSTADLLEAINKKKIA